MTFTLHKTQWHQSGAWIWDVHLDGQLLGTIERQRATVERRGWQGSNAAGWTFIERPWQRKPRRKTWVPSQLFVPGRRGAIIDDLRRRAQEGAEAYERGDYRYHPRNRT